MSTPVPHPISTETAYRRLAIDPAHSYALRRLAEGWERRQVMNMRRAVSPEMIARSAVDVVALIERDTVAGLVRELVGNSCDFVIGMATRWCAVPVEHDFDPKAERLNEVVSFANNAAMRQWANGPQAWRCLFVCEATATFVPDLPRHRRPDGQ